MIQSDLLNPYCPYSSWRSLNLSKGHVFTIEQKKTKKIARMFVKCFPKSGVVFVDTMIWLDLMMFHKSRQPDFEITESLMY